MANRQLTVLNPGGYQELLQNGDNLVLDGNLVSGLSGCVNDNDAARKKYVDDEIAGVVPPTPTLQSVLTAGDTATLGISLAATQFTVATATGNTVVGGTLNVSQDITTANDVSAVNFIGNGSQLTGLASTLQDVTTNGSTTTTGITVAGEFASGSRSDFSGTAGITITPSGQVFTQINTTPANKVVYSVYTGDYSTSQTLKFMGDGSITAAGDLAINTDALFVDASAKNVGIGNTSVAFPSGTGLQVYDASTPRIKLANSTTGVASGDGLQIYVSGSEAAIDHKETGPLKFYTSGSEAMRLDSSGNVGIGLTSISSSRKVEILQPSSYDAALRIRADGNGNDGNLQWYSGLSQYSIGITKGTDALKFQREGSEKMRIDSSGSLLIGPAGAPTTTITAAGAITAAGMITAAGYNIASLPALP